jgi:hypothetical protein
MYIPPAIRSSPSSLASFEGARHVSSSFSQSSAHQPLRRQLLGATEPITHNVNKRAAGLVNKVLGLGQIQMLHIRSSVTPSDLKRDATAQSMDLTIGIVVGVLLGVFFLGLFGFLYVYRKSVKFASKKHRRRKSGTGSSKSSKSSKSSDGGGAPPPPPAPPPPAAA